MERLLHEDSRSRTPGESIDLKEKDQLETRISDTDAANQRTLAQLLGRCGWPGALDKRRAAFSTFLIIQHAPLDYQPNISTWSVQPMAAEKSPTSMSSGL